MMTASRPITLTAYAATYKATPRARTIRTIRAFFAESPATAYSYAARVVDRETFGAGVLLSVQETEDPRELDSSGICEACGRQSNYRDMHGLCPACENAAEESSQGSLYLAAYGRRMVP